MEEEEEKNEKLSMVILSGDMDKIMGAFIIATGAVAFDMDVTMFFTFWGLRALQKKKHTGESFFGKILGLLNPGGIDSLAPSKYAFGGLGNWMFKKMMKKHNVTPLHELLQNAIDLGVNIVPCQMSMDVMEIKKEDLVDGIGEPVGVGTFIAEARESQITLFV